MKHIAIIALFIFYLGLTQAQVIDSTHSDRSHIFSLCTGFSKQIERDDAMSPFKYRGHSIPIEFSYRSKRAKSRQICYANFAKSELTSSIPNYENAGLNHYVECTNIQMGYSYLLKAYTAARYQSVLHLGGEFYSLLNLRKQAYINNNEFLMLDQFNSLGFRAQLEKCFTNNKQAFYVSLSIPIVSYVLMGDTYNVYVGKKIDPLMNYSGNMLLYLAKKGDFVSFNKLVYFKTDFSYVQFIGSHIGIECKYSLRYYKFTQYQGSNYSRNLQNQYLIGIVCKL